MNHSSDTHMQQGGTCHTQEHGGFHSDHDKHNGHGMSHGSALIYLKRFWIVTFLLIPLVLTHEKIIQYIGFGFMGISKWIQFGIATVIMWFALVFFQHALHEIRSKQYGMMTLVSLAVGSGYLFSVVSTFLPGLEAQFYLEISTLVWVLLFGHYLEARSSGAAGNALEEVARLLPKQAHKKVGGKVIDVDVSELQAGDIVIVKPGEKVPADGIIQSGTASVDESLVSGESKPVQKKEGANVVAGSICLDSSLTISLDRVGEHSTVGQIQKLIAEAGKTKPKSQRVADRASAILTVFAGTTALVTLVVWTLVMGEPFVFALTLAITVLVIACPHALGLAIPTVTTITTSLAVRNGFFIKDLSKIEVIKKVDYVVFDKTGTLTKGEFGVVDVVAKNAPDKNAVLQIAASLEQHSSHIIGLSIIKYAESNKVELLDIKEFKNIAGQGVAAHIGGTEYFVGNEKLMADINVQTPHIDTLQGTVVFVANKKELLGLIVLADEIKKASYKAIQNLHDMGIKVAMLTGDNKFVAKQVSDELGIDTYFANVLPKDKYQHIKELQDSGSVVLMVGDGVNDAPALTQADAGVAIGAGTDVAVESGDVVLMNSDPQDIARLIILSKKVYAKMIQNLVWALGYNIIAIPTAAGVFAVWGFFLRPEIGALVMSLSTVIVVANAMLLKKINLEYIKK